MKTIHSSLIKQTLPFLLIFLFVASSVALKAGDGQKITIGEKFTIHSKALNEDRKIMVYTPTGYENSDAKYPVVYLLDGETHFVHAYGVVDFLSTQGLMPQSIVVAIVNVDRGRDFTPSQISEKSQTGGAAKFTAFIKDELKPYINKNYRTQPFETIYGHSLGGMYVAYTFLTDPDMFDGYIAVSPYLQYDEDYVTKMVKENLKDSYDHKFFYMTLGEEPAYYASVGQFVGTIETKAPKGLQFDYFQMSGANHASTPHLTMYNGMQEFYSNWKLPKEAWEGGIAAADEHYKKLSQVYGYTIETPEYVINQMGYNYMWADDFDKAVEVLSINAKRFPGSANVYDSLGEALEKSGKLAEARNNYEKAVKMAKAENNGYLKVYEENLNRVQELVAEK